MQQVAQSVLLEITIRQLQAQNFELMRIIAEINNAMNEMSQVLKKELEWHVNSRVDARLVEVDTLRDEAVNVLRKLPDAVRLAL